MIVVEIFCILVCNIKQFLRIAVDRTAVVDFELNAEVAKALAVKYKVGRVAVFVDNIVVLIPAGCAAGIVVIIPIGTVAVDNPAAVIAADVILIKAVVADLRSTGRRSPRRASRLPPDTCLQPGALCRSLHKFLFRSLSVPPFHLVNINILRQAA